MTLLIALLLAAPPPPQQLKPSMQAAMTSVVTLQPLLVSPTQFRDPANADRIRTSLDTLTPLDHFFSSGVSSPIASLFAAEVAKAKTEFAARDTETARARLRSISSLCFACHLRQPTAKDIAPATGSDALTPMERASFYATTRQFERALAEWKRLFATEPTNDVEAFEQTQALRTALSVLVQGKDDPDAVIALLEQNRTRKALPGFVTRQMERWLVEAKAWQAEKFVVSKATPAVLVTRAKALVEMTGIAKQVTTDDARLISHLRASGYLLEALRREPNASFRAEALWLLGVVSAATTDPALWRLEWLTLESCIRENPKTELARQCADRLTERTYFTYTGRDGLELPAHLLSELGALNALAR